MSSTPGLSPSSDPKELAVQVQKKLQEAYDRGTISEATKFLIEEFTQLRKVYNDQLKVLRKQVGL
jgi:hypothetical protein